MRRPTTTADNLVARIADDCDSVIDTELSRLRRRRPELSDADYDAIDEVLTNLADRLLLDALRDNPSLHPTVARIFTTSVSDDRKANHD